MIAHKQKKKCQWQGCDKKATGVAYDRYAKSLGSYCQEHSRLIAYKGDPEYIECCPNCGCEFGVN